MSSQSVELTFVAFNTLKATITVTDFDGTAITGITSGFVIKIIKPDGTEKEEITSVTDEGSGVYSHYFDIALADPEGVWEHDCRLTYGSKYTREVTLFKVD